MVTFGCAISSTIPEVDDGGWKFCFHFLKARMIMLSSRPTNGRARLHYGMSHTYDIETRKHVRSMLIRSARPN